MTTNIKVEILSEDLECLENDILSNHESDKCGEVFVTKRGIFSCFCIVCKQYFEEIGFFTEHILSLHLDLDSENNLLNITESYQTEEKESPLSLQLLNVENKSNERYLNSELSSEKHFENTIESNHFDPLGSKKDDTTENNRKNLIAIEIEFQENAYSQNFEEESLSDFNKNLVDDKFPFKCEICNRSYKLKNAFIAHQKCHENVMPSCSHCGKNFCDQKSFKSHNQILCAQRKKLGVKRISKALQKPKLKCKYCTKIFKRNLALKCHEERHLNSPFKCNHCSKSFMVKYLLDGHIRTHTGERPYKCKHCTAAFTHITNLNRHTLIHVGEKTYVCTFGCGKAFYKERERAGHERTHTGEKTFVCELCGTFFGAHSQLTLHKKRVHMDKKNRPYKCDQCDKAFLQPKYLREHLVVHTGEKPFACDQCSGRFSKPNGLREHKKLHSGIKKHICTICSKAFAQTAGLYGHMKSHGIIKENTEIS